MSQKPPIITGPSHPEVMEKSSISVEHFSAKDWRIWMPWLTATPKLDETDETTFIKQNGWVSSNSSLIKA